MKKILFFAAVLASLLTPLALYAQPGFGTQISQYLNIKAATSPSFSPDGKTIAYLTNVSGTYQVWSVAISSGTPRQLTNYDDGVSFVRWLGDGSGIIFGKAKGGDENTQFYWMRPDGSGAKAILDELGVRHNFGTVTDDGKMIAYASNKRDRKFFDVYVMDLATGKEQLRYQQDGNNDVAALSENGSKIVVSRDGTDLSLDNSLYLIDSSGREVPLTPHTDASVFENVHFVADGIVYAGNSGREFVALQQLRKRNAAGEDWTAANRETSIIDNTKWDVSYVAMNAYGSYIAYTLNREGFSELYLRKYETGGKPLITSFAKTSEMIKLPGEGIVSRPRFNSDQTMLTFSFTSASRPSDIWVYDLGTKKLTQVTSSSLAGVSQQSFIEPRLIKYNSFDGREISGWFYEPVRQRVFAMTAKKRGVPTDTLATMALMPVIISVHGGPEGQELPGFNPLYQYYLSRGYAILATNVRGSTGYGKTFTHLDDLKKREDSVKDLAFAVDWLKSAGGADPKRIAIMGGSYGGYMTLAAITLYPELWAAAVDTVGIANWESFLTNTSGYRRRQREVEYGRLDRDIDFLRSISPLSRADRIQCPLFVIQGKNDPRVPYTEAEQIVAAIHKRKGVVEYKLFDDEGHGIAKLKNRLELYPMVANFLDRYMNKP